MGILNNIKQAFIAGNEQKETHDHHTAAGKNLSPEVYIANLEAQRTEKDHYFKHSPQGPIEDRVNFTGLNYYPPDPAYRYELSLQRSDKQELLTFQTSTGAEQTYHRLGAIEFEVDGETAQLAVYRSTSHDGLFLPFRDATSGKETYGAGRYLEPHELGDDKLLVDFNLAYNPFCAYSEAYSCPLPPFENHLARVAIRAGEKLFK